MSICSIRNLDSQLDNGKPLPFEKPKLERTKTGNLLARRGSSRRHGESGIEVSELLPHTGSRESTTSA